MGYYIQTGSNMGKVNFLRSNYGAEPISEAMARTVVAESADSAIIVVVDNGDFEAAGLAYDSDEFRVFTHPADGRGKAFLRMDRKLACKLAGYRDEK